MRQPVAQPVGEGAGDQRAVGLAIFHDMGVDRRLLDHGDIVEQAHVAHAAAGMARIQIGAQQRELLARRFRRHFRAAQVLAAAHDALLAAAGREISAADAHRHTGRTAVTGRAIGDGLAAAEAGMGEGLATGAGPGCRPAGRRPCVRSCRADRGRVRPVSGRIAVPVCCVGPSPAIPTQSAQSPWAREYAAWPAPDERGLFGPSGGFFACGYKPGLSRDRRGLAHQQDGKPAVGAGIGVFRQQRLRAGLARDFVDPVAGKPARLQQGAGLRWRGWSTVPRCRRRRPSLPWYGR